MKTIIEQNNIIKNIVGIQSIVQDKKYRLIAFCLRTRRNDEHLLYNSLTKELLLFNNKEISLLDGKNYDINNPVIKMLISKWFLVPIDFNEKKLSDQISALAKSITLKPGINTCNIFTTTACNARCFYCFEAGAKTRTMTAETADAVADYIIDNCIDNKIVLQWFGGEPLCNTRVIDIICKKLSDNKIDYKSFIITNGYLFDEDLVTKAKDFWKTKYIQITLDGLQETYNKVKKFVNAVENPFAKVINNIQLILDKDIFMSVRMNMDLYNKQELYELTDFLYKKFGSFKNFEINVSLIYEDVGFKPTLHTVDERELLFGDYFTLRKYQEDLGVLRKRYLRNNIRIGRCSADNPNAVQILPGGELGNCEHYPDDYFYGTVFDRAPRQLWTDYADKLDICDDCAYYPMCFMLKRCNTKQCSAFRKKKVLNEMESDVIYTYEQLSKIVDN